MDQDVRCGDKSRPELCNIWFSGLRSLVISTHNDISRTCSSPFPLPTSHFPALGFLLTAPASVASTQHPHPVSKKNLRSTYCPISGVKSYSPSICRQALRLPRSKVPAVNRRGLNLFIDIIQSSLWDGVKRPSSCLVYGFEIQSENKWKHSRCLAKLSA